MDLNQLHIVLTNHKQEQIHLQTPPIDGRSAKYSSPAATCLAFEEGQVNQFYIGTEEGAVYHGARHGR